MREAQSAIEAAAEMLEREQRTATSTLRHAGTGRPLAWANPAVGLRNAIAPPMVIHHEADGRCWSEFTLGARVRGAAGVGARRHLRAGARPHPRRGGQRRADQAEVHRHHHAAVPAWHAVWGRCAPRRSIERTEGVKTFARGYLSDAEGITVEAEGVFIRPAWARDAG